MMVLALVIGKSGSDDNEGCSNKINGDDDGSFDCCLVHREGTSVLQFPIWLIFSLWGVITYVALLSFWYNKKREGNYPPQGST
jgi:hypothetical protein